jgi:hypothetical protein
MEMFIHFQVLCDDVAGHMGHILRTPKRLQAAVSNRSAGGKTPPVTLLLASSCRFRRHCRTYQQVRPLVTQLAGAVILQMQAFSL